MQVIDNFISLEYQQKIKDMLLSGYFPWYLNYSNQDIYGEKFIQRHKNHSNFFDDYIDNIQMTHSFFSEDKIMTNERNYKIIEPLIFSVEKHFDIKNSNKNVLRRIKSNLLFPSINKCEKTHNIPHVDSICEGYSALYYINDSDGDTIFFKETTETYQDKFTEDIKISPKMGRLVFFDSSIYHTSSCPINSKCRSVINILYTA